MRTLGLIVNPVAGMGGAVGLKGTDGEEILGRAIALGAKNVSAGKAKEFIRSMGSAAKAIGFLTCPGQMGEDVFRDLGIPFKLIEGGRRGGSTSAADTRDAAKAMMKAGVDVIAFCGGDGTARVVLDALGQSLPAIGIPSGVKMHSGVFAVNPRAAGEIALKFLWGELPVEEAEVADVDEEAFREGRLSSRLYGYLLVPYEPSSIQGVKAPTSPSDSVSENIAAIAKYIAENMQEEVVYIMGPGSTVKAVNIFLGLDFTLLGVDLLSGRRMIRADANENDILETISGRRAQIVVSPIGGQGFIFGRGNQQISAKVLSIVGRESVTVISTRDKLASLDLLRVDTGDEQLDSTLSGPMKVLVDYGTFEVKKVA